MDEQQVEAILDGMMLEERVALLAGASFWTTVPIERLGVPAIKVTDGPNGARGGRRNWRARRMSRWSSPG